jgi:hypothetical protein
MKDVCTFIAQSTAPRRSILQERPEWHELTPRAMPAQPVDEWEDRTEHDRAVASYLRTVGLE